MKKLALSIAAITAAVATNTHAETFESEDGINVDITGDVKVQYEKSTIEDSEADFVVYAPSLGIHPSYTADNGVTAFGHYALDFDGTNALVEEAYVGLETNGATISAGVQDFASADFGIGQSKSFGTGDQLSATSGSEVVKATYEQDGVLKVSASYDISENDADDSAIDLYGEYSVAGATVAGTFQSHKVNPDADALTYIGVSGAYELDAIDVGAELTYDMDGSNLSYEVAGSFAVTDDVKVAGGLGQTYFDNDALDTLTQYYANAEYSLHDNASAYVEVGGNSVEDSELGYVVGMKVSF